MGKIIQIAGEAFSVAVFQPEESALPEQTYKLHAAAGWTFDKRGVALIGAKILAVALANTPENEREALMDSIEVEAAAFVDKLEKN